MDAVKRYARLQGAHNWLDQGNVTLEQAAINLYVQCACSGHTTIEVCDASYFTGLHPSWTLIVNAKVAHTVEGLRGGDRG